MLVIFYGLAHWYIIEILIISMLKNKTVAVVVPAYNEETQIGLVIESMPEFVDRIIIINDFSNDKTSEIVKSYWTTPFNKSNFEKQPETPFVKNRYNRAQAILNQLKEQEKEKCPEYIIENYNPISDRIVLLSHKKNEGKGAGVITGYKWCKDNEFDCVAIMDGDGQMDPEELESICTPIIRDNIDYVKGNRLIHQSALIVIPKVRFIGNSILSILTKMASGYWKVSDTQTGYTAISKKALNSIRIHDLYRSYGYPNDLLVKLNIAYCTLKEIEIKPVYDIGEKSKMKIWKVIPKVSWLLFKSFFKRLWIKYLFRDFHPLFLLYHIALVLMFTAIPYGIKILEIAINGRKVNPVTLLAFVFLAISGFQSLLFAMWMDIQDNERLYK